MQICLPATKVTLPLIAQLCKLSNHEIAAAYDQPTITIEAKEDLPSYKLLLALCDTGTQLQFPTNQLLTQLFGKPVTQLQQSYRCVSEDGKDLIITADYDPERLDVSVVHSRIVDVH